MSFLVAAAFVCILGALVAAGYFMLRGREGASRSGNMVRALTVRIAVSVVLFLCIIAAWRLGWIHPTGIPAGR